MVDSRVGCDESHHLNRPQITGAIHRTLPTFYRLSESLWSRGGADIFDIVLLRVVSTGVLTLAQLVETSS